MEAGDEAGSGPGDDLELRKREIRASVRTARAALDAATLEAAREGFAARIAELLAGLPRARSETSDAGAGVAGRSGARPWRAIAAYSAIPGEPDPGAFFEHALARDFEVLLPAIRPDRGLAWIPAGGGFAPGPFGIPEPIGAPAPPDALARVELLLVPACAVGRDGVRLGWGGGYYDRALAAWGSLPPVYALVHDAEVFDALPRGPHDIPVTGAVTPTRILRFA